MSALTWLHRWERDLLLGIVRLVIGGKAEFSQVPAGQCIYFSNHASHLDALLIMASLPLRLRNRVRPVAGADYWSASSLRRYIATKVLNAVLIDRTGGGPGAIEPLEKALDEGDSLIVFPEGTRQASKLPGPFKSGLFHLTRTRPHLALVPAYLENLHRVMLKGAPFPLPLLCRVHFGNPIRNDAQEEKAAFLDRARGAVCNLAEF